MTELVEVSGCNNPNRHADVVFVHGLGGDALATWGHSSKNNMFWPEWLAEDFTNIGVWSLSYASSPSRWMRWLYCWRTSGLSRPHRSGHSMALSDRALQVLDLMLQKGLGQRPILFICHSLGGLLVKKVLRCSSDAKNNRRHSVFDRTHAVLFLATPHNGSTLATILTRLRWLLRTTVTVDELRMHDANLRELFNWYRNSSERAGIHTSTYYETLSIFGITAVDPTTSQSAAGEDPIPLDENHLSIAKPKSRDSQVYVAAKGLLQEFVLAPKRTSLAYEADATAKNQALEQLAGHNEILQSSLKSAAKARLDSITQDYRYGNRIGLIPALDELERDINLWNALEKSDRARAYRLRAHFLLACETLPDALESMRKADSYDAGAGGRVLQAEVALTEGRRSDGIELLADPVTHAERLQRVALYVAGKDIDAAKQDLELLPDDPIALTLQAYVKWLSGDEQGALETIEDAAARYSKDYVILKARVLIHYALALPTIVPGRIEGAPIALPPGLAYQDINSIEHLKKSESIARELAQLPLDEHELREIEAHIQASLALRPDTRIQAENYATELLFRDEPNGHAVGWALQQTMSLDIERIADQLNIALRSPRCYFDQIHGLIMLLTRTGRHNDALEKLDVFAERFSMPQHQALIKQFREELKDCVSNTDKQSPSRPSTTELAAIASQGPTTETLLTWWQACVLLAVAREWKRLEVALPHLKALGTAEAARMCIFILHHTNSPKAVLEVIEESKPLFGPYGLPASVQQLRIEALASQGRLIEADQESSNLLKDQATPMYQIGAFRISGALGDHEAMMVHARALEPETLDARQALFVANAVATQEPALARAFWKSASKQEIPEDLIPTAALVGMRLDVGSDLRDIMAKFQELSARGDSTHVVAMTFDEVVALIRSQRETQKELEALWRAGSLPIHRMVDTPGSLAQIWSNIFRQSKNPAPWFMHAGNHPEAPYSEQDPLILCLDTTTLLTAWMLDLLDTLEAKCELWLAPSLPELIRTAIADLHPHQPNRFRAFEAMQQAVEDGKVQVVSEFSTDTATVGFTQGDEYSINLSGFLLDLERISNYSPERAKAIRDELGSCVQGTPTPCELTQGSTIGFDAYLLSYLVECDVLSDVTDHWNVVINSAQFEALRQGHKEHIARIQLARQLDELRKRIRSGLARGNYRLLSRQVSIDEEEEQLESSHIVLRSALELLSNQIPPGAWLCFDDRFLHAMRATGAPVLNTVDVIDILERRGDLSKHEWLRLRLRLRQAGAVFIPLHQEEILAAVKSPTSSTALEWSQTLVATESDALKLGNDGTNNTEWAVAFNTVMIATKAIDLLWDQSIEESIAIQENSSTVLERFGKTWWTADSTRWPPEALERTAELQVATLLISPLTWTFSDHAEFLSRLECYGEWLNGALIEPIFAQNPNLEEPIRSRISKAVVDMIRGSENTSGANYVLFLVTRWIEHMPSRLRDALNNDATLTAVLAPRTHPVVEVGSFRFEASSFFRSISTALAEGDANLQGLDNTNCRVISSQNEDALPSIRIVDENRIETLISGDAVLAASSSPTDRIRLLKAHPEYWDGIWASGEEADKILRGHTEPMGRVDSIEKLRQSSMAYFYEQLRQRIDSNGRVDFSELKPCSVDAQLSFLRLNRELDLDQAAERLLADLGCVETARRLAALPIDLPDLVSRKLHTLEQDVKEQLVAEFLQSPSLTHRVHGFLLAHAFAVSEQLANEVAYSFAMEGFEQADAFRQLLSWALSALDRDRTDAASIVCAWSHVGSLLHLLPSLRSWSQVKAAAKLHTQPSLISLLTGRNFSDDALDPIWLTPHNLYGVLASICISTKPLAWADTEAVAAIRKNLYLMVDEGILLHPNLFPHPLVGRGNCWLRRPADALVNLVDPSAQGASNLTNVAIGYRCQAIDRLKTDPCHHESWAVLVHVCSSGALSAEMAADMADIASRVDINELYKRLPEDTWQTVMHWIATGTIGRRDWQGELRKLGNAMLGRMLIQLDTNNPVWVDALLLLSADPDIDAAVHQLICNLTKLLEVRPDAANYVLDITGVGERFLPLRISALLRSVQTQAYKLGGMRKPLR